MTEQEFAGRTALVTGGSRGIGRACVEILAAHGADVAVNFRANEAAAQQAVAAVERAGRRAMAVQADVADEGQVRRMVEQVERTLGPIDLLVNNAGVFHRVPHDQTTREVWNETMSCNVTGVYLVTWAVKQSMIERRFGRIVNITSVAGLRPRPQCIAYATSKAAVIGFTRSVAAALAEHNIRVNAVAPGLIETDIHAGVPQSALDAMIADTPIQRIGQPDDISEVVRFLLSDQSRFMTGQTLSVCGGRVTLP